MLMGNTLNKLNILEQITRNKVYNCTYWKEKCFSLNSETIIDNALELKYIGGVICNSGQPSEFICLVVKLIQLNPGEDILKEYLSIPEYKYLRALTAFYVRLVMPAKKVYEMLEPLYCDYRKLRMVNNEGKYELIHMDEFIEVLLEESGVFNIALPKLVKRKVLEENEGLGKRVSLLDEALNKGYERGKGEEEEDSQEEDVDIFEDLKLPEDFFNGKKRKRSDDNNNCNENDGDDHINEDKGENKSVVDISDLKVLDENSDEYWLALRKKIGLN